MTNYVVFNPGTGPVEGSTESDALANVTAFAAELSEDVTVTRTPEHDGNYAPSRLAFRLSHGERSVLIHMPGLPLDEVCYVGDSSQNIWHFPRLYVNHSSWVWCFALGRADDYLFGDDEDGQS